MYGANRYIVFAMPSPVGACVIGRSQQTFFRVIAMSSSIDADYVTPDLGLTLYTFSCITTPSSAKSLVSVFSSTWVGAKDCEAKGVDVWMLMAFCSENVWSSAVVRST